MSFNVFKNTVLLFLLIMISCGNNSNKNELLQQTKHNTNNSIDSTIIVAANQIERYLSLLNGKRVGIVANQTSVIFKDETQKKNGKSEFTHLVDSLLSLEVNITKVFAPEHGFRGTADAGEKVKDGIDTRTGLPIISLYGKNKKPSVAQLQDLDIVVFDIQDVGARFYTYISSLHYVMEACAEQNIPLIILDRPNPNGHYVDGPVLELEHQSFVGMHPAPIVHGMTIGEYAQMINGESWLENGIKCDITIIPVKNYTHNTTYSLPIKPSPNLPNDKAINLYPSLCLFEGTNVSAGRGTDRQFQIFGSPFLTSEVYTYQFTPQPNNGAKHPKHKGEKCFGMNLARETILSEINLNWLINAYNYTQNKDEFFIPFFTKLAGTKKLQQQIENKLTEEEIKATWLDGLEAFKKTRKNYLIYN